MNSDLLTFSGPYAEGSETRSVNDLPDSPGVYLWCVEGDDGDFLVHYVGEAQNIRARNQQHFGNQRQGRCHAYHTEDLKRNVLNLMHRAGVGVVDRFKDLSADEVNTRFLSQMRLFAACLPESTSAQERRQIETAIVHRIEDSGPNVLNVARINRKGRPSRTLRIDTGNVNILNLSGQEIDV